MNQPEQVRATIEDIARRANVSISTVSRVINGLDRVRPQTRQRVLAVVEALRYQPSALARGLAIQQTHSLGFVIPTISDPFYLGIVRGVEDAAVAANHNLLVASQAAAAAEPPYLQLFHQRRVDGMVVVGIKIPEHDLRRLAAQGFPVALVQQDAKEEAPSFLADNYGGARSLAGHLLDLGHRRIAYIAGSDHTPDNAERLRGLRDALARRSLPLPDRSIVRGDYGRGSGYRAMNELLTLEPPEAVFAANDQMAMDAMMALRERGLKVPDDVAVVGFDDIPGADYVTPPLTTVRQPTYELGFRAASSVLRKEPGLPTRVVLPTELVIRRSCGNERGWSPSQSSQSFT